jgi:hypothetical protein
MKSRWVVVSVLSVMFVAALLAVAVSPSPALAQDPWAGAPLSTQAPAERAPCQNYANDCVFDGGPCGPTGGNCHCQFRPTGWICGK